MKQKLCFCYSTALVSSILVCGLLAGAVFLMTNWAMDLIRLGNVDLKRIRNYGKEYPDCDLLDQEFRQYQELDCTGNCSKYCDQGDIIDTLGLNCVYIAVSSFEEGYNIIPFTECYNWDTIDWSELEERGELNGAYLSTCMVLCIGIPTTSFFICYYIKKFCNCCESFVFSEEKDIEMSEINHPSIETT